MGHRFARQLGHLHRIWIRIQQDQPLGRQYCEVIMTCVLKQDAILPHPYDNMETIADGSMMSVAWPYNRVIG
jgi:hypothetical protein